MNSANRTVELHQAFLWTCEECGRDNFERAVHLAPESVEGRELSLQAREAYADASEAAEALGVELDGAWLMAPSRVRCPHCGTEFEAIDHD